MYVQRLIEFAEQHPNLFPPIGFQKKKIDWIVDIDQTGLTFNPVDKQEVVPTIARSSGTKPMLLVDKPDYAFGFAASEKNKKRSEERHQAYVQLLQEYVEHTQDEDVQALLHALEKEIDFPDNLKEGDFIAFRIRDETYLHESETVKTFWSNYVQPKSDKNSFMIECMFCGQTSPAMKRHSISFVVGGERTKMISANKSAYESHGNKASYVAPTCYLCEQKYGQALEHLLQREPGKSYGKHMFSVGDLTYVYWLRTEEQVDLNDVLHLIGDKNIHEMKDQLDQVFKGRKVRADFQDFCLLVLSVNKGRLVVRDYMEESMGIIHERIQRFLDAQNLGRDRLYSVYTLASTIYQKASTQMQKVDVRDWFDWIFQGKALPGRILVALLKRIQAEGAMYPQHAAVLKSWLVSQNGGREWTVKTDQTNKSTSYMLGRVFAVLEKIHGEATGSKDTLGSRFFGAASATPRAIFGLLIKNAQYHLKKISSDPIKEGRAIHLDRRLRKLLKEVSTIPSTLKLTEQAEFTLGYYHEKESLWTKKEEQHV
ncbi:type I-C CRISPR-associated protein Cas8c/Csd1 [Virgibacillus pantothenticus]|uniref:type I-C CRISPR-associated protein Cas8c/Csd1 n=1 Tax=Virgibacillus pantothenticus TaxID=1473 RepID=UPI00147FA48B|nr:type I-C CRISPR-associated protein Cas8c/Csd1 [Virgibacillus pantothenticus]